MPGKKFHLLPAESRHKMCI